MVDRTSGKKYVILFQRDKSQTISSNYTQKPAGNCYEWIGQISGHLRLNRPSALASRRNLADGYVDASPYLTTPLSGGSDAIAAAIYAVQDGVTLPEWIDPCSNRGTAIRIASGCQLLKKISDIRLRFIKDNCLPNSHVQTTRYMQRDESKTITDRPLEPSEFEIRALESSNVKLPLDAIKYSNLYSTPVCCLHRLNKISFLCTSLNKRKLQNILTTIYFHTNWIAYLRK